MMVDVGGHEKKLFKIRFRSDTRKFVFSNRVVDNWNSLSAQCEGKCKWSYGPSCPMVFFPLIIFIHSIATHH